MNLNISNTVFNLVITIYFIGMILRGYRKGGIRAIFDIASTIIIYLIAYFYAPKLANMFTLYSNNSNLALSLSAPIINYILVFLVVFIGLKIVRVLLNHLFIKHLDRLFNAFIFSKLVNKLIGAFLYMIEATIILYVVLAFVISPFFKNGNVLISQSYLADTIVQNFPLKAEKTKFNFSLNKQNDTAVLENLLTSMLNLQEEGLISSEQANSLIENQFLDNIIKYKPSLDAKKYEQLKTLLSKSKITTAKQKLILQAIEVK